MFLVLIEYVDDGDREWSVCPHGRDGRRTPFDTFSKAEKYALTQTENNANRYAIAQVTAIRQADLIHP